MHTTVRARRGLPPFRAARVFTAIRGALGASSKLTFRVVHFSVQNDHLHLLVEATDADALSRGMRGLVVRVAKAVNRATGRAGPVWGDRYHIHQLRTPLEARNALVYVLSNWRKHHDIASRTAIDPRSSAEYFDGWRTRCPAPLDDAPVRPPRTWLLRIGWRGHGLLRPHERPRGRR